MKPNMPSQAAIAIAAMALLTSPSFAQDDAMAARPGEEGKLATARHAAGQILTQPVRDVGLMRDRIPEVLARAAKDPYAMPGDRDCQAVELEIDALNASLGQDTTADHEDSRLGRFAEAGGKAAVNSLIPFRVLVREVTGAATAQRRLQEAVDHGYARRGFLRGVLQMWSCSTLPAPDAGPAT